MQDQPAITSPSAMTRRQSLHSRCRSFFAERRDGILALLFAVTIVGAVYGSLFTAYKIWQHNGRTQAVARAQKMDGETYMIKGVAWNWVGDTRLYLTSEQGEDAGWVMIHLNNPFTREVNPLFLALSDKRDEPLPFPMKVRVHYRQEPWTDEQTGTSRENYTGSFLDFEQVDQK